MHHGLLSHRKGQVRVPRIKLLLWQIDQAQTLTGLGLASIGKAWNRAFLLTTPSVNVKPEWVEKYEKAARAKDDSPDWAAIIEEQRFKWKLLTLGANGWEVREV